MATQVKYIIICAGEATRWNNFMGTAKHFAVLNNEPILNRTIRLLDENNVAPEDIYVVSKDYSIDKVNNYHPKLNKNNHDADKFLSSKDLWNKDGRTVILYGDVYFSEYAIKTIVNEPCEYWRIFCRPTPSEITGTPYGECFAVSFYPHDHKLAKANLKKLIYLYKGSLLNRIGGWEWARIMAGVPIKHLDEHQDMLPVYITIDDETDDLDFPEDYLRLEKTVLRLNKGGNVQRYEN